MFRRKTAGSTRHVIIHYHIFKNAGTTVESILKINFRERFAVFDSDDYNASIGGDALLKFLAANPGIEAVSSHHLRYPKPVDNHFEFHDIVFLRHPIARLWSTYEFYRRSDVESDPLAAAAKDRSARGFFQLLADEYPSHASNAQVNLLANGGHLVPHESDLPRAAEVVAQASVLGTAEQFDESAVPAEYSLRRPFKKIDFSYVAQNVTANRPVTLQAQVERFQKHCGMEIYERIMQLNQLDLALVQTAEAEVALRFLRVPGHARRLKDLRSRCVAREVAAARIVLASHHPMAFASYASPNSV